MKMIPLFKVNMPRSVMKPLQETLMSGFIGQGKRVEEFEFRLPPYVGTDRVLTLNSCTSAIHLALRLAGVGPGDEVVSTPMTCTATNEPILERGARIVWADINPLTGGIVPEDVERKITKRTKAVVCVHWAGYPCDLMGLLKITEYHGIKLIEDAAHAFGASYRGCPIGGHGDFVCFSFQAIKHMTTVDGGLLCCKNENDYHRGKLLRWYGIDRESPRTVCRCEDDIAEYGYKFHMNDVNATIGIEQLKHVRKILLAHRANAHGFERAFRNLAPAVRLPAYLQDRSSSYWVFPLLVERKREFIEYMTNKGIMVSMVHKRNDGHTMMKDFHGGPLPGVDQFEQTHVAIPCGWWLTSANRARIIKAVTNFAKGKTA